MIAEKSRESALSRVSLFICSRTSRDLGGGWIEFQQSPRPFKTSGSPFLLPPHAFSLVSPYESILEPQLIRAYWRIIHQSSSSLVSSQTNRCPTHVPTAKPLRPTVVVLPPLMTIHLCVSKNSHRGILFRCKISLPVINSFQQKYPGETAPNASMVTRLVQRFCGTGSVADRKHSGRSSKRKRQMCRPLYKEVQ
ncbi:uncharacterized protein TNCV_1573851 [Trichonephila clavipes]|nr:uncharacterized protein TNCV_1573851 [Trichonephila clavipes]